MKNRTTRTLWRCQRNAAKNFKGFWRGRETGIDAGECREQKFGWTASPSKRTSRANSKPTARASAINADTAGMLPEGNRGAAGVLRPVRQWSLAIVRLRMRPRLAAFAQGNRRDEDS